MFHICSIYFPSEFHLCSIYVPISYHLTNVYLERMVYEHHVLDDPCFGLALYHLCDKYMLEAQYHLAAVDVHLHEVSMCSRHMFLVSYVEEMGIAEKIRDNIPEILAAPCIQKDEMMDTDDEP